MTDPHQDAARQRQVRQTVAAATMPLAMASVVKRYLKDTPEYDAARAENRARRWLDEESLSLGHLLAETITARLGDLDA